MQDDFSVFWRNNDRAYELFQDLLARAEKNAYDDDFLVQLAAYREAMGNTVHADIFAAQYLLANGDAENAVICGERAFARRAVSRAVWQVLAVAYEGVGRELDAITMQGHIQGLYPTEQLHLTLPKSNERAVLDRFSLAANYTPYAPILTKRAYIENDVLQFEHDIFLGEAIPLAYSTPDKRHWVGIYVDEGYLSIMSCADEPRRHDINFFADNRDATFDIQKAREVTGGIRIEVPEGASLVLPVAGTLFYQNLAIKTLKETYPGYLGKWAFSYLRLDDTAELHSDDAPFAVGTPIHLGHSPQRKKLVLNLLIDGMCWPAVRPLFSEYMPHLAAFFAHGVIFEQHFSTSEYTFPSFSSIETGCYSHHTQIFNEKNNHVLPPSVRTCAEEMSALGYYCSAPLATGQSFYTGVYRGYDRIISTHGFQPAYEGAERILRILEALPDVDHFMLCHTNDVHPLNLQSPLKFSTAVERSVSLTDRFVPLDPTMASVSIPYLPIYLEQLRVSLRHIDRSIGAILDYIETHYREDEYIVNLYSDHGCSIFDPHARTQEEVDLIGAYATGATWMMRGAGVPEGVRVQDLTSNVDIYPTLAHLCGFSVSDDIDGRLPAIFGGTARDVVYSSSQFPGQTFKLAVRSATHTLRVETQGFTQEDGTANFAGAMAEIYPRGHEFDPACAVDSAELRSFFYSRAREFVREIANNGEVFA